MQQLKLGKTLLLVLLLLVNSGCKTKKAPAITICIGDGIGGCDGVDATGSSISESPSQLNKWIMIPPAEFASYASYCQGISYDVALQVVNHAVSDPAAAQKAYFKMPSK